MSNTIVNKWVGGGSVTVSNSGTTPTLWVLVGVVSPGYSPGGTAGLTWTQQGTNLSSMAIFVAESSAAITSKTITIGGALQFTVYAIQGYDINGLSFKSAAGPAITYTAGNGDLAFGATRSSDGSGIPVVKSGCTLDYQFTDDEPAYDYYQEDSIWHLTNPSGGGSITIGVNNGYQSIALVVPQAGGGVTASWSVATATTTANMQAVGPIAANWATATATTTASMQAVVPIHADWGVATATATAPGMSGIVARPVTDNFNGTANTPLTIPWTLAYASIGYPVRTPGGRAGAKWNAPNGVYAVYYNQTVDPTAHFAEGTLWVTQARLTCGTSEYSRGFELVWGITELDNTEISIWNYNTSSRVGNIVEVPGNMGGHRFRLTCAGRLAWIDIDDVTVLTVDIPPMTYGWPGIAINEDGSMGNANGYWEGVDDFYCGNAQIPSKANWLAAVATATASMSQQIPSTANWASAASAIASVPSWGMPVPSQASWVGATAVGSGQWSGLVSRDTYPNLYPIFAAFGSTKGRMTIPGAKRIGTSKGIGQGDRVFLHVPHADLLGSGTVARVWLHLTPVSVMSTDYNATVHPSGTLFNVKPVTSAVDLPNATWDGMAATLGSTMQSVTAKPTWLSGQLAYDGVTRGNPINPILIDITSAYNNALAGGDLDLCLECALAQTDWECELFGNELSYFRPRIEVQYLGETIISLADLDSAAPKIDVTVPGGATLDSIKWGYDEQCTPQGGTFKYSPVQTEGLLAASDRFPLLESSMRVHVEVRVDHGTPGVFVYQRTFKTPQAARPALRTTAHYFSDWLDVRGPTPGWSASYGENFYMLVKRTRIAWATGVAKVIGDCVVSSNGKVYYAITNGTTGATEPTGGDGTGTEVPAQDFSDGGVTWRYGSYGATGDGWDLFRATSYLDSYKPIHWVGSVANTWHVNQAEILPFPSPAVPPDHGALFISSLPDMHLIAADVSEPHYVNGSLFFLSSHVITGGYEIRLNKILIGHGTDLCASYNWGVDGHNDNGFFPQPQVLIATVTSAPDLKLSSVGRCGDWRTIKNLEIFATYFVAFVADGNLQVYEAPTEQWATENGTTSAFVQVINISATNAISLTTFWTRTINRIGRTVVAVPRNGSDLLLFTRNDNDYMPQSGGGVTCTSGTWTNCNLTSETSVVRVWSGERALSNMGGDVPDEETCHIALQRADGTVKLLKFDGGGAVAAALDINPDADWTVLNTWNRTTRAVKRWPPLTNYTCIRHDGHGGVTLLGYSGSNLLASGVRDDLRVTDETQLTLPATITEVYTGPYSFFEGEWAPLITKHSDNVYRVSLIMAGMDISRLDLPNQDQILRFQSGKLTVDSFVRDSPDMHTAGLTHLPGHNVFSMKWTWDEYGLENRGAMGIMNHIGWHYWAIAGCKGERAKIIIHQTPAFGGIWKDGDVYNTENSQPWQPEAGGGTVWMTLLSATWFYTYDSPADGNRRWMRLWETDYVLDGESVGGAYVLCTPCFTKDKVWIAHDPIYDVPSFVGDFQRNWKDNVNVKFASPNGELLDPDTGQPLSQVRTMPQW